MTTGAGEGDWRIVEDDLSGAAIRALLEQHFAGMLANSPAGSCHFLDFDGLRAGNVTFWSIHDGDTLAGCGALKQLDAAHGEIKSMRTADAFLRRGVAARMLDHIIDEARRRGLARLSLETGSGAAFEPAIALYRRYGFDDCAPFADYKPDPFSRFMTRVV
ncbi:MAG: GNAT family N-acetyltransferase [Sphingopyxis sp.]|uniref:GNAT family N-acetyltransferase n=1 Tax=unclassified Sphingopyxis TaxID=2614943 RepID=UPI0014856380|nr:MULTISPECIES: GNAT family N-acetyltransferase [unclassified Sphingopyxis]MBL9065905.1 GNAT family N-acetyltransferase [Sphingopyxis sp.]